MSIDPRRTQPFCTPRCWRECRCSRWPGYLNRFGWPVRPRVTYDDDVLATGPIAYWPQSETAGLVAHCLVNPAQDGTYTGVTLADDNTGPFGTPAPFFDGANDYNTVTSAALAAAFDGTEGTMMAWARTFNWADAAERGICLFHGNLNNRTLFLRAGANTVYWNYQSGGVVKNENNAAMGAFDWFQMIHTWSETSNWVTYYLNGAPYGAPDANPQNWAVALSLSMIGAYNAVPQAPFHGWIGPVGLWDRALTAAEVAGLYV